MKFEDLPEVLPSRAPQLRRPGSGARRDYYEWTDERCDLLRKRHGEGWSFGKIANELGSGITRNAVIGKAMRMGLTKRGKQNNGSHAYRNTKPTNPPQNLRRTARIMSAHKNGALRLVDVGEPDGMNVRELPADQIPIEQRKTLLQLRSNDCRWPYGDPHLPEFFFCGAEKERDSYCAMHARIASTPSRYRDVSDDEHRRRSTSARRAMDRRKAALP